MLDWRLLLHCCLLKLVVAFHVDQDCEVKSKWEGQFTWSEFHIKTWLPPEKSNVLELSIKFEGKDYDLWNDKFVLSRRECTITKLRDLKPDIIKRNVSVPWQDGWIDIIFKVDKHYKMYLKGNADAIVEEVLVDIKPKFVEIIGSNITLNCPSDMRVWHGTEGDVIVPLNDATHHWLSFYSNTDTKPSITLGQRKFSLGWNGNKIATIGENLKPLPAFISHNFTVICRIEEFICSIQVGQNGTNLEDIRIGKLPDFVMVKSEGKFSVLLFENDPIKGEMVQEKASDQSPGGQATVILLILLLIVIVVGILCYVVYRKILKVKRKSENDFEAKFGNLQETIPLLPDDADTATLNNPLLEAVIHNKIHKFKNLVTKTRNNEDYEKAYVEAHLLCRREILNTLESPEPIGREELIQKVLEEYSKRVDKVFEAARKGNYRRGVAPQMQSYELPATIRDTSGRSLLHVIASATDPAGGPLWSATDIKEFFKNETCYPNAVDFESKTCLHYLVSAVTKPMSISTRLEQQISPEFTWKDLAEILIEFGCDPRIRDAKGQLPHELARQKRSLELCELLEKACQNFDNKNNEEANFKKLLEVAKNGDTTSVMKLMTSYQELLPLEATKNPLTVSATRGHLETTMLLLSGGAWICGRSAVSTTPFEAVNSMPSLPAIFPVVMRRECVNRLRFEHRKIGTDKKYKELDDHVDNLIKEVEKGVLSIISSRTDEEAKKSEKTRFLLNLAAQLGLSLTCQMFGFENVVLQPSPKEDKPVMGAIQNGQKEIIYLLYRDFQMSIFCHIDQEDKLPADFLHEVWTTEFKQLKRSLLRDSPQYIKWLEQVALAHTGSKDAVIENQVLAHIAERGLVYIFHIIKKNSENFDVNAVVDSVTGCTMLHIAAMYGRLSMIEYLLYDKNVKVMATSKGGYTAAHLAAIRGNKQCLSYLQYFMQEDHGVTDVKTDGGQHIDKFLSGYELLVRDSELLLLSDQLGIQAWSAQNTEEKAEIILENINSRHIGAYKTGIREFVTKYTRRKNAKKDEILEEFQGLLQLVTKVDPSYKGNVIACRSNADGLNIPMDAIVIYWEVNSEPFTKFKITHEQNGFSVNFENKDLDICFKQGFLTAVQNAVKDFKFKSSLIRLTYPSITLGSIGVTLYVIMYDEGRTRLISVLLVPVLKTDFPKENRAKFEHPVMKDVAEKFPTYLSNWRGKKWTHITVKIEDEIITRLTEEQRLVMTGCKLITKILYSCWWFPKQENRRHSRSWHAYAVQLDTVPDRILTSLFLEEVNSTKEEEWKAENYLDHMISIFRKAVTADSNGILSPKKITGLFLDYEESSFEANASVCSIVRFLQKRKSEEKKT